MKNIRDLLHIIDKSQAFYRETKETEYKNLELDFCSYLWFCALGLSFYLSRTERGYLKSLFTRTSSVCEYSNSFKTRIARTMYKIFGFDATAYIFGSYLSVKNRYPVKKEKISRKL